MRSGGKERLDADSFGDNLVLPLVSMTQTARRGGKARVATRRGMTLSARLPVAQQPFQDELLSS